MINNDNRTWYSSNSQTKSYNICEYYRIHMSLLIVVLFLFSLVSMPGFVPHYSKLLIVLGVVLLVLRSSLVLYRNVCIVSCGSRVTFCITCFTRLTRFTRFACITVSLVSPVFTRFTCIFSMASSSGDVPMELQHEWCDKACSIVWPVWATVLLCAFRGIRVLFICVL